MNSSDADDRKQEELQLKRLLKQHRQRCADLQLRIQDYETQEANLVFRIERARARIVFGRWGLALLALLVACFAHACHHGSLVFTTLTAVAFLANWRRLYVRDAPHSWLFAVIVAAATIILVRPQ